LSVFPFNVRSGDVVEINFALRDDLKKQRESKIKNLFEALKKKGENK
jgi:hypothetical protein